MNKVSESPSGHIKRRTVSAAKPLYASHNKRLPEVENHQKESNTSKQAEEKEDDGCCYDCHGWVCAQ